LAVTSIGATRSCAELLGAAPLEDDPLEDDPLCDDPLGPYVGY
jgi:hypothetical protein